MPQTGNRPAKNPYRPGVGLQPTHLAGREPQIRRFRSTLASAPEIPANLRLTGLRGVGKTVLLRRFEQSAQDDGWATVMLELEPRHNSDERLTALLANHLERLTMELSKARRIRGAVSDVVEAARRSVAVSFEGFEWSLGGDLATRTAALAESLAATVESATRSGREGVVLLFDEAQILYDEKARDGDHPLSMLLAAVSLLQRQDLPVALVLCGLPTLTINHLEARTYSERMFRGDEVGSLPTAEARQAFLVPLEGTGRVATEDLVERVLTTVDGYPYFIQELGHAVWTVAEGPEITKEDLVAAEPGYEAKLDAPLPGQARSGHRTPTRLPPRHGGVGQRTPEGEQCGGSDGPRLNKSWSHPGRAHQHGPALHTRTWLRRLHCAALRSLSPAGDPYA